jgi:hypothetical protein
MEHGLSPLAAFLGGQNKLKHDSALGWRTLASTVGRGTVEIPCFIKDHSAGRVLAITRAALKAVERFFLYLRWSDRDQP